MNESSTQRTGCDLNVRDISICFKHTEEKAQDKRTLSICLSFFHLNSNFKLESQNFLKCSYWMPFIYLDWQVS